MKRPHVIILANGIVPDLEAARRLIPVDAVLICADGGLIHALALGLRPHFLIGDLDSTDEAALKILDTSHTTIIQHRTDKDETDLELAINHALDLNPASVVIVGALGARLDHTLGNIALLSDPRLSDCQCRIDDGIEELVFCRDQVEITGNAGDIISLVPWGGAADGVRTNGLRWALRGEQLLPERTRGISNEMLDVTARILVQAGALLVIHRRGQPIRPAS